MSSPTPVYHDDYEVVDAPEASAPVPENPTPTPATDDARSIRDLFDKPTEPQMIQTLAKTGIFLSLPHQLMWSVVTAIFVAMCQPTPNDDSPMDEVVYKQITLHTEDRLKQCRKRLEWVDKELPGVVERCNNHITATMKQVKSTKEAAVQQASPIVSRTSHIALFVIAAPILGSFLFSMRSWIGAPLWLWLGLGYWIGKRRERWTRQGRNPVWHTRRPRWM